MTEDDDRVHDALARLPLIESDLQWETQVRERCHSVISRRAFRKLGAGKLKASARLPGVAAAVVLCVYLATMLAQAAQLAGLI